ncbi:response regulator transcription factor [Oscillatoria sp. FACHB-1407]|uniref:response regulator n=1 Tax=Oscillatoria sp. FACHB-1407 TaxID=2692847 RepID=UPI00168631A3|nr:response regulator transcription factor [Oscillatoria sp. FACHB-1407]MBD2462317.1 response regulator transcription factor [Oscillatoria sp. FACHB-1407]
MIRILLVDDQAIIREALKVLLEQQQDFEIVGTANDGQGAIAQVEALKPDVLLIDILMPGMDGITATQIIYDRFPDVKVIVLSGHDDERYLSQALRSGAKGYLLKNTAAEDLANTIRSVYRGHTQLGPGLVEKIIARVPDSASSAATTPSTPQSAIAESDLLLLLDSFDVEALTEFVNYAAQQNIENDALGYVGRLLKENPTNLSALYLTGTFLGGIQGRQKTALQYLKFGFKEGIRQKLGREGLLLFYRQGLQLEPETAFSWLTQPGSPWNSEDGWVFLFSEATERFGKNSAPYRSLLVLRRIRALYTMARVCTSLNSKLLTLQQGFERLDRAVQR